MSQPTTSALVSLVLLNYNGGRWLQRCFESIRAQTIFPKVELVFVDNGSTDDSLEIARRLLVDLPGHVIIENKENLGFCEGNNVGARAAQGEYLLFLNMDAWLEDDCLERLVEETKRVRAAAATPLILDYEDDNYQNMGFFGFDVFGLPSPSVPCKHTREVFVASGCSYLIERELFLRVGLFDPVFFLYTDEVDLSWRVWIAGERIVGVPSARLHHRGAASVNPKGGGKVVEVRTSDEKRFLANRNNLLTLLKNGRHLLLLLLFGQLVLLLAETLVSFCFVRRWSFVRRTCFDALTACWQLRGHVHAERRRIARFRIRSDLSLLRFLRWRLNRWFEIKRLFQYGFPKVEGR